MSKIIVIPDTQVKPYVNTDHLEALGNYCVKHKPDTIIHLGDHWDMHSLSSYDHGRLAGEGTRYQDDINFGIEALQRFLKPIEKEQQRLRINKKKVWNPRKIFLIGNHENRILRHVQSYPILEGKLSYQDFQLAQLGFEQYDFLVPVYVDGIYFSHYWVNPDSAKKMPFASSIDSQLTKLGFSFVQGHKQGLYTASPRYLPNGRVIRGLIVGSFYSHEELYMGPQGNPHWRGAVQLNECDGTGWFSPIELSIDYLLRKCY